MAKVMAAAVQASPVFLDRDATVGKAAALIEKAAGAGAELIAFAEAFVPTYPDWVWRTRPWDDGAADWFARLLDQSVTVPGPSTKAIGAAARQAKAYVAIGVTERERESSTLFNTYLYFGPDGSLLGKHRKLMPTGGERLVWGSGDGSTLFSAETPFGRLGGLICWENYMPLARAAVYAQGVDVYLAPTWDNSDTWVATLRHIAKEGRVYVIGINYCIRASDVPNDIPGRDAIYGGAGDWLSRGNTAIVGPEGDILAGPLVEEEGILMAELDIDVARKSRRQFDPVGHYARPDVFRLAVNTRPAPSVTFGAEPAQSGASGRESGRAPAPGGTSRGATSGR
ncbi:MAG: carbon-nitrogen hydrolase family protein [Actinobacteria bacterium]|nr:carbon-nitrogen hydrolase family protein [Actinomycetota bacterium]